jgi:predicted metal-dependent peptidase
MEFSNLDKAKTYLVSHEPFFATLMLSMPMREAITDEEKAMVPSMGTNGEELMFNREFVDSLDVQELVGVLAHEVMHVALMHPWRCGARDKQLWNMAGDFAINNILDENGFTLPRDGCHDKKYAGMSSEEIYRELLKKIQKQGRQKVVGDGGGALGGDLHDPPSAEKGPSELAESENMARVMIGKAVATAKNMGKLPGSLAKHVDESLEKPSDWASELRRFMTEPLKDNQSWQRQQRRFVHQGIYLPAMYSQGMGRVAVIVDTSGSVYDRTGEFISEVQSICEDCKPKEIIVIQVDATVQDVQIYEPGEDIVCKVQGGGGTDLRTGFTWLKKQGIDPVVMVVFTDMETPFPEGKDIPDYPVTWVSTENHKQPFGDILYM